MGGAGTRQRDGGWRPQLADCRRAVRRGQPQQGVADLVRVGLHLPSRGAHRPYLHLSCDQGPRLSSSKEVEHAQPPVATSLGTHQRKRLWRERPLALKGHPHPAVTPLSVICGSSTLAVPIVSNRCLGSAAGACLGRLSIFGAISSSLSS